MAEHDPIADLRRKFIASLSEAARPTLRQIRVWEFLRYAYGLPPARYERDNVEPIGPGDREWLEEALGALDDLDVPEVD